jgi:hypothetical protein
MYPPDWWLDARLTTLPFIKFIVTKFEEVRTGTNLAESHKEGYG